MSRTVQAKPRPMPPAEAAPTPLVPTVRKLGGIKLHHSLDEDFSVYGAASFVERFFATLIDYFIMGILMTLMQLPFLKLLNRFELLEQTSKIAVLHTLLFVIAFAAYQLAPQALWGQTLGKTFFGIRVVTLGNSAKVSFVQILWREVPGKLVSSAILGMGFLMMLWRPDKRTLHDLLFATKVVKFRR